MSALSGRSPTLASERAGDWQRVKWAAHGVATQCQHVGVSHGGVDVCMAQQRLDRANVAAALQQMRCQASRNVCGVSGLAMLASSTALFKSCGKVSS